MKEAELQRWLSRRRAGMIEQDPTDFFLSFLLSFLPFVCFVFIMSYGRRMAFWDRLVILMFYYIVLVSNGIYAN